MASASTSSSGLKKICPSLTHEQKRSCIVRDDPLVSIRSQCALLGISRESLAYVPRVSEEDVAAMRALDELYIAHPFYGSRKMRVVLARDYGIALGRHHIRRLMRKMGLEAIYPKAKPRTSDPNTSHRIYPYLLGSMVASHPNHIWGTDITYIRLNGGWCYLVALLDWHSRYVVAWALAPTLELAFCLENLELALTVATPEIHNSDQGSHFTSPKYTAQLEEAGVRISMDGRGRCMDNIFTERLWRTVKYEEVYLKSYETIDEARHNLTTYFRFYNEERPHQSLDNRTPAAVYFGKKKPASAGEKTQTQLLSNFSTVLA